MGHKITLPILMQALKEDPFYSIEENVSMLIDRVSKEASPPFYRYCITGIDDSPQGNLIRALSSYGNVCIYPTPEYRDEEAFSDPDWALDEMIFEEPPNDLSLSRPDCGKFSVDWIYCAVDSDEIKSLLRRKRSPLPQSLFGQEPDNTIAFSTYNEHSYQELLLMISKLESVDREILRFGDTVPATPTDALSKKNLIKELKKEKQLIQRKITELAVNPQPEPTVKKRKVQIHQMKAREVAKKIWAENPDITIADMGQRNEINELFEGKVYSPDTLRKWLHDLCPNPNPGRRPKKK